MIYPDKIDNTKKEEHTRKVQAITRKLALAYAFIGVFFFFFKILFF